MLVPMCCNALEVSQDDQALGPFREVTCVGTYTRHATATNYSYSTVTEDIAMPQNLHETINVPDLNAGIGMDNSFPLPLLIPVPPNR